MRIISGKYGGRQIVAPKGRKTHPMGDKIRGALFNALGDIEGLTVLDAFAGSGAIGIEAISRGANFVIMIDKEKTAYTTIDQNLKSLGISDEAKVIRANASSWSDNNPDTKFDIVILDPPYDSPSSDLLEKLAQHSENLVITSLPANASFNLSSSKFKILSSKSYADARLDFYRIIS